MAQKSRGWLRFRGFLDRFDRVGLNFFFPKFLRRRKNFRGDEKKIAATKKIRNARTIERTRCQKVPGKRRSRVVIDGYKIDAVISWCLYRWLPVYGWVRVLFTGTSRTAARATVLAVAAPLLPPHPLLHAGSATAVATAVAVAIRWLARVLN